MKKNLLILALILWITGQAFAQTQITGQVKTSNGDPLPGASIVVKGTTQGTVTDANGNYTLSGVPADAILVITFMGMLPEEVVVGNQSQINVSLVEDIKMLDEVVVVGYGSQKKANLTSAVEVISPKEIQDIPVGNLGAALRGTVNGLSVSGGMERQGVAATVQIRTPFDYSKDGGTPVPMLVIDDVIQIDGSTTSQAPDYSRFNNLDPSEIESITVLKDGAAAIYGARASQGAIIVTTKKGKYNQAPKISYSGLYGWNDATSLPKTLSAYEQAIWWNKYAGAYGRDLSTSTLRNFFQADELEALKTMDYNWLDKAWKAGNSARHTISIDGGGERATYFASATYYTQNANLTTGDYHKWTFRAGSTVKVASNFTVSLQLSGDESYKKNPFNKVGGENLDNDYIMLVGMPKYFPWEVDGQYTALMLNPYTYPTTNANNMTAFNYFQMQNSDNYTEIRGITYNVNFTAEYKIPMIKGLSVKTMINRGFINSITDRIGTQYTLLRPTQLAGTGEHLYLSESDGATYVSEVNSRNGNLMLWDRNHTLSYQANFFTNYERQFGRHNVAGMFSVEKTTSDYNSLRMIALTPLVDNNGQSNTATGGIDASNSSKSKIESGGLSYLGRVTYNFADKYNFTYTIRADASTKFAPDNYWGVFQSYGAAWVISDEDFFKDNIRFVNYLKLRGTLGFTGKDNTKAWQWRQRYTYQATGGGVFGTSTSASPSVGYKMEKSPNADARWDNDTKYDIGIDAAMLKDRLSATIDLWKDHNYNMLIVRSASVPVTVGGSTADENYASVDAYGIELSLTWKDKITKDLSYSINIMTGLSDTKVRKWDEADVIYPWTEKQVGKPVDNGVWGYDCLGMFRSQTDIDDYVAKYLTQSDGTAGTMFGTAAASLKPGMLYYRDVRGSMNEDGTFEEPDGIVDENDQVKLAKKSSNPYGFTTNLGLNFKGIQLTAQLSTSWGGWNMLDARTQSISAFIKSPASYWADMYDPDLNPNGKYPNEYAYTQQAKTSKFWEISSFRMAINTITLSYALPNSLLTKLKINGLRINAAMTNVASLYNPYPYRDPLTSMDGYPTLRTVSLGVNLTL